MILRENNVNRADYVRPEASDMAADLETVRDLVCGITRLREQTTNYLPKHSAETADNYAMRLARTSLLNGLRKTVASAVGLVFSEDPVLGDDVPPLIVEHAEDADNAGTALPVFLRTAFEDALVAGHGLILVDAPMRPTDEPLTLAQERALGLRPYWVWVRKEDIINWRAEIENGRTVLTLLVLQETTNEEDGEYGVTDVTRYRVLRREVQEDGSAVVTFEIVEKVEDEKLTTVAEGVIANVTEIPVAPFYTNKTGVLASSPPLIDLAWQNVLHYRLRSGLEAVLSLMATPVLVCLGADFEGKNIVIGPNTAITSGDKDSEVKFIEPAGTSIGELRQYLGELAGEMATSGMALLQREHRQAETAEAKRIDAAASYSQLRAMARMFGDTVELALYYHAQMLRLPTGGSIEIYTDFADAELTAQEVAEYRNLVAAEQLSVETLWDVLKENGRLPRTFDTDLELERIGRGVGLRYGNGNQEGDE